MLAAVVAGEWDRAAHERATRAQRREQRAATEAKKRLGAAITEERWEDAIVALDVLIAAGRDTYVPTKFVILLSRLKQYDRGYAYGREIMKQSWDTDSWLLYQLAWNTAGYDKYPIDDEHRDLDFALEAAKRAVVLEPLYHYSTMLARIHAQRGELAEAVAAHRQAIETYKANRPKVRPGELKMFEEGLVLLRMKLQEYERRRDS